MQNHWNFWLCPAEANKATPDDVLATSTWKDAEARLAAGGKAYARKDSQPVAKWRQSFFRLGTGPGV